jgi:cytochrome P450
MTSTTGVAETAGASFTYDPFSREIRDDPYPIYRELRNRHPLYHQEQLQLWVLSRYDDIASVERDWKRFSSHHYVHIDATGELFAPGHFIEDDPPHHTELRKIVQRYFTPKVIRAEYEEKVRAEVRRLLLPLRGAGTVDLIEAFTDPLPLNITCQMLGIPASDQSMLLSWFRETNVREVGNPLMPDSARVNAEKIQGYLAEIVEDRRRKPTGDMISNVVAGTLADGAPIEEEAVGMTQLLFAAGIDTTSTLLSSAFWLLASHPDQRAELARDPSKIGNAVEEVLRCEAPLQNMARTTTEPVEFYGTEIPAGEHVVLLYGAANRDESRWEHSDIVNMFREPKRHHAFGIGVHACMGADLARLEARVVLEEVLALSPEYTLEAGAHRINKQLLRGFDRLPATL